MKVLLIIFSLINISLCRYKEIVHHPGPVDFKYPSKYDLSNEESYLSALSYCYFSNKNPNNFNEKDYSLNGYDCDGSLNSCLKPLTSDIEFKELSREVIGVSKVQDIFGAKIYAMNHGNVEQDKVSTMLGWSSSYSVKSGVKFTVGFKYGQKISADALVARAETSFEVNLGVEYNQDWTSTETVSVSPTFVRVPAKSKVAISYAAQKNHIRINGLAKVKLDPNQDIRVSFIGHQTMVLNIGKQVTVSLMSLINELKDLNCGKNLFNSNKYLTLENGEIFANIAYKLDSENYDSLTLDIGEPEPI